MDPFCNKKQPSMNTVNNNIKALTIGLLLILAIGAVAYFKSSKKNTTVNSAPIKIHSETTKSLDAKKITTDDLLKKIQSRENFSIIDIRPSDEYEREHILNSENISVSEIETTMRALDKKKTYILIDNGISLEAASVAINFFSRAGFENAFYLDGGFLEWKNQSGSTISSGDPESLIDQLKIKYISAEKLKELMAVEKNLLIIDLRAKNQFNEGHLDNAVNIFLDDLEKQIWQTASSGKKIILYGEENLDTFKGAIRLFDMGFMNTMALSGGFGEWKQRAVEVPK